MDLHPHRDYGKLPVLCHTHVTVPAFSHLSFSTCFKCILFLMFYYFTLMYLDMDSFYSTVWDLLSFLNLQPNFIIIKYSFFYFHLIELQEMYLNLFIFIVYVSSLIISLCLSWLHCRIFLSVHELYQLFAAA